MVGWEEVPIEVVVFETKWMLHLTVMVVMMTARTVGWDDIRKLTENDKLKALLSKLKSHSDNWGTFMVTLKMSLISYICKTNNL